MTWPRDLFAEAVWASSLRTIEKIVALAYADHARDQDEAFVTLERLQERTGLSRGGAQKAIAALREAGWLTVVAPARQHRTTRYRLEVPSQPLTSWTPESSPGAPLDRPDAHTVTPGAHLMSPGAHTVGPTSSHTSLHDLSPDGSALDPWLEPAHEEPVELSDADRIVVEERARQLGMRVDVVAEAASRIRASTEVRNLRAYLARMSRADLEAKAGRVPSRPAAIDEPGQTCGKAWHVKGGMRIHGTGADASRVCPACEAAYPAARAAAAAVQPPARVASEAAS